MKFAKTPLFYINFKYPKCPALFPIHEKCIKGKQDCRKTGHDHVPTPLHCKVLQLLIRCLLAEVRRPVRAQQPSGVERRGRPAAQATPAPGGGGADRRPAAQGRRPTDARLQRDLRRRGEAGGERQLQREGQEAEPKAAGLKS